MNDAWICPKCKTEYDEKLAQCFGWSCQMCDVALVMPEVQRKSELKQYTAISLWQPWASLMTIKAKHYETRSWSTRYRGLIMLHSAKRWTKDERLQTKHFQLTYPTARTLPEQPPLGSIVGAFELIDVHQTEDIRDSLTWEERAFGDYSDGRFAWEMRLIKVASPPIPAKGDQGLWTWTYAKT